MMEGCGLFIDFLFRTQPLRKIYLRAPEYNLQRFASVIEVGAFRIEGRLNEHRFYDGRYWDEIILALYLPQWREMRKNLLSVLGEW